MNLKTIKELALKIHADENGDIPVGQIMVIGLIGIPLVVALVAFKDDILDWLSGQVDEFKGGETEGGFEGSGRS